MLDISKSERYFILCILIIGVSLTYLSYYKKTTFNPEIKTIEFEEPHILVNVNTANRAELMCLPGIGPVLAERIIVYRDEQKRFTNVDELKNVKGIGDKKFEEIKDLIGI